MSPQVAALVEREATRPESPEALLDGQLRLVDVEVRQVDSSLKLWRLVSYVLGVGTAALAAAAAVTGVGDLFGSTTAGALAFLAAVVAGVDTKVAPDGKVKGLEARRMMLMAVKARLVSTGDPTHEQVRDFGEQLAQIEEKFPLL